MLMLFFKKRKKEGTCNVLNSDSFDERLGERKRTPFRYMWRKEAFDFENSMGRI